jgi:hypothetical protein
VIDFGHLGENFIATERSDNSGPYIIERVCGSIRRCDEWGTILLVGDNGEVVVEVRRRGDSVNDVGC